jgi:hypothetical protein
MKKILFTITIFLFAVSSYAEIKRSESTNNEEQYSSGGGLYGNSYSTSVEENSGSGVYKTTDNPNDGTRPGGGEGIGQETPVGNGLCVLAVCCLIYCVAKTVKNKTRKEFTI